MKIGIFDSGIGGVNVLINIIENFSNNDIYYFADTKNIPYGTKSDENIKKYSYEIVRYLEKFNIELLIIACNTASAISLDYLKEKFENLKIIGVINSTIKKVLDRKYDNISIMATDATINSDKYRKELLEHNKNLKVKNIKATNLATLIEKNELNSKKLIENLDKYLENFNDGETLVLACTHYSLLKNIILKKYPNTNIVDSSLEVSNSLINYLEKDISNNNNNKINFFVSGNVEEFDDNLKKIFKLKKYDINKVER